MLKIAIPVSEGKTIFQINQAYVDYVYESGYNPILVTPRTDIQEISQICDGLLLPGGIDLDPVFYDEDNVGSNSVNPRKDDFERTCLYAFIGLSKPVFGICRGFQLIIREALRIGKAPADFVSYWQHINKHRNTLEFDVARDVPTHSIIVNKEILYGNPDKKDTKSYVNSIHHQAIIMRVPKAEDLLAPVGNFVPLAVTKHGMPTKVKGYIVEAFEIDNWNGSPIRAVQWHPEELKDVALLTTFFEDAANPGKNIKKAIVHVERSKPKMASVNTQS